MCKSVIHRETQLELLNAFIDDDPEIGPPNIIVHGFRGSGKTCTIKYFFEMNPNVLNSWVNAIEMVTGKPFVQHVAVQVSRVLKDHFPGIATQEFDPLTAEDFSSLAKFLYNTFKQYDSLEKKHSIYIVLDDFDLIDELDVELFPKFSKLHELLPNRLNLEIKFIKVIHSVSFLGNYATYSVPTIIFPIYSQNQVFDIVHHIMDNKLATSVELTRKIFEYESSSEHICYELSANFVSLILHAFHSYSGNDPGILIEIIDDKWHQYIRSINKLNYKDTPSLYKANIQLFKKTGDTLENNETDEDLEQLSQKNTAYGLSFMLKYLLIAAYLTSYLDPRFDSKVFSKKSHLRAGRSSYGRRNKMSVNPRFLQPSLFSLERLLAIFQSIYPVDISNGMYFDFTQKDTHMRANVEVYENFSELNSLKLITSAVNKSVDYLHEKVKWKVNVSWEIIIEISKTVNFDISEYFTDVEK